jgi:hypothetical protein
VSPEPYDWSEVGTSEPFGRPEFIDVLKYAVRDDDPSAEISVPAADKAAPEGHVILVEPSPKAK